MTISTLKNCVILFSNKVFFWSKAFDVRVCWIKYTRNYIIVFSFTWHVRNSHSRQYRDIVPSVILLNAHRDFQYWIDEKKYKKQNLLNITSANWSDIPFDRPWNWKKLIDDGQLRYLPLSKSILKILYWKCDEIYWHVKHWHITLVFHIYQITLVEWYSWIYINEIIFSST